MFSLWFWVDTLSWRSVILLCFVLSIYVWMIRLLFHCISLNLPPIFVPYLQLMEKKIKERNIFLCRVSSVLCCAIQSILIYFAGDHSKHVFMKYMLTWLLSLRNRRYIYLHGMSNVYFGEDCWGSSHHLMFWCTSQENAFPHLKWKYSIVEINKMIVVFF